MTIGPPPSDTDALVDFYAADLHEAGRLVRPNSRLEFLRTQELLRARLPQPPSQVLDVGGGTGVHSTWLAADGHRVTLVDVVPEHVRRARQLAGQASHPFTAQVGDARALAFPDASVDACLLLGPLYHLPDRRDRMTALVEAARTVRPGGIVCAAAISRCAWPLYAMRDRAAISAELARSLATTMATGVGDPVGDLPNAYSHQPAELAEELRAAGLRDVEVLGIEGPGWAQFTRDLAEPQVDVLLDAALRAARLCDDQPGVAAASAHLLACGRRP